MDWSETIGGDVSATATRTDQVFLSRLKPKIPNGTHMTSPKMNNQLQKPIRPSWVSIANVVKLPPITHARMVIELHFVPRQPVAECRISNGRQTVMLNALISGASGCPARLSGLV